MPLGSARAACVVLLAVVALPAGAPAAEPCAVVDPILGFSCPVPGGHLVHQARGGWMFTHGWDPPPPGAWSYPIPGEADVVGPTAVCALTDAEPQGVLVYAAPSDRADRYATMMPQVQAMWQDAAARLWHTGLERGLPARYRMHCEVEGALAGLPLVANVRLSRPVAQTSFGSVVDDLQAAELNLPLSKYWVWVDLGYGAGGVGHIYSCALPHCPLHNVGPLYAVTFGHTGSSGAHVMMHESGHTMGAVQLFSPNSSGGFHCNDGWDVMCYADGGKTSDYNHAACTPNPPPGPAGPRWDCNGDDYFHPLPPPGSYLSVRWNTASPANLHIVLGT